jgi:hypothetical protein
LVVPQRLFVEEDEGYYKEYPGNVCVLVTGRRILMGVVFWEEMVFEEIVLKGIC